MKITAAAAALLAALVAAAPAAAATPSGSAGGWVATPDRLQQVTAALTVPALTCASTDAGMYVGVFGADRSRDPKTGRTTTAPWLMAVAAKCHSGKAKYAVGLLADDVGVGEPAHPGDRVILTRRGDSMDAEIESGSGGVDFGFVVPGVVRRLPRTVVGGVMTGTLRNPLRVRLRGVRLNRAPLASAPLQREVQRRHGRAVAFPSRLARSGTAFTVTIG